MKRSLLLVGIVTGFTIGWLVADPPAPHKAQASPTMTAKSNNPKVAVTGAPPGEGTCADCHGSGADNSGPGTLMIFPPATYVPGQTYAIAVGLGSTGALRWGFEATALDASQMMAGTFTKLTDSTGTQTQTSTGRMYENQVTTPMDGSFAGSAGPVGWVFAWTAPAQGKGTVTFYCAGVAANNNNNADSGDLTYTTTATSTEGSGTPVTPLTWGIIKNRYR